MCRQAARRPTGHAAHPCGPSSIHRKALLCTPYLALMVGATEMLRVGAVGLLLL